MIRVILAFTSAVIFFLLSVVTVPILFIIGLFSQTKKDIASMRCVQFIFRIILVLSGTNIIIEGRENIISDRAALYTGNHISDFDIIITYTFFKTPTSFISKKELLKVPFLNFWMIIIHCVFLDRKDKRAGLKTVIDAVSIMKKGISVSIYPEGTRNKTNNNLLPFKPGSFKIATKIGAPIVPVVVYNTDAIFEKQKPFIKSAKIYLGFLEPIKTEGMDADAQRAVCDRVYKLIDERIETVKKMYFS